MDNEHLEPLQPNVGGVVAPDDLVGRDLELQQLLDAVLNNGARLLGDRRIGKTALLGKLEATLRGAGHTVVRVSAETENPATFMRWLSDAMNHNDAVKKKWGDWKRQFGGELKVNLGVVGLTLTGTTEGTASTAEADLMDLLVEATRENGDHYRTILIIDEVTVLTGALEKKSSGDGQAFLRNLRAPRQRILSLSVVLAGSIGLHHVIEDFTVVNDLTVVDMSGLREAEAVTLALRLLRGTGLSTDMSTEQENAIAVVISEKTDGLPYYIQALVNDLANKDRDLPLTADRIAAEVDDALRNDRWGHSHYDIRIDQYYGPAAGLVRRMLDEYATAQAPLSVDQPLGRLKVAGEDSIPTRDEALGLIRKLEADHYLVRDDNDDRFASDLLRRAWLYRRRLAG